MKLSRLLLAAFFLISIFSSLTVSAQDDREDVVYLKNGSVYRGIIVEQVPGESINIETIGGNIFHVVIGDILKIAKEKKAVVTPAPAPREIYGGGEYPDRYYHQYHYAMSDSMGRHEFHPRKNGYFNTVQVLFDNLQGGLRMVNGYRFGRLGYLGVGIGVDFLFADMHRNKDYSGIYFPLYLHYGGDILKRRITPFYSIEAGYAMRINTNNNNFFGSNSVFNNNPNIANVRGGMMGGVGFGVKFYTRHRGFISISAHANFKQASNTYNGYTYDPNGNYYPYTYKTHSTVMIPGLRLGIGF